MIFFCAFLCLSTVCADSCILLVSTGGDPKSLVSFIPCLQHFYAVCHGQTVQSRVHLTGEIRHKITEHGTETKLNMFNLAKGDAQLKRRSLSQNCGLMKFRSYFSFPVILSPALILSPEHPRLGLRPSLRFYPSLDLQSLAEALGGGTTGQALQARSELRASWFSHCPHTIAVLMSHPVIKWLQ